ncbi:methyl-accepting chemotaxis protein [Cognatiyoonia sp. IB215446]|uniref:methyl-accepting chemotaxis protein n=1 Tax=Cognatiyoonia sp. IB215446 TaxID=3097355 RepID=UPI002A13328C|nr:methyl-accepting chemotaxis protein [Cognatiyoonia sp. IB215446]MDX8348591.1 methyl-accepting chemotaxis protein [Cognatiyoonia sp. IB215446]
MINRLAQVPIRLRLPLLVVGALLTSIALSSYVYFIEFKRIQTQRAEDLSATIAENAADRLEIWLANAARSMDSYAKDRTTGQTLIRLADALRAEQATLVLADIRRSYVSENPFPADRRQELDVADRRRPYDQAHEQLHFQFRNIVNRADYDDLMLILPNGLVAYSVKKSEDFATNVENGPYASSGLGRAFRLAMQADPDTKVFVDFERYVPSGQDPVSFMAQKVVDLDGTTIGVVAIQLSAQITQRHLGQSSKLGADDEVYLIGTDGRARSVARSPEVLSVLEPVAVPKQLEAVRLGVDTFLDDVQGIRGAAVSAQIKPFDMLGLNWSIIVELNRENAYSGLKEFLWRMLGVITIGAVASTVAGYFVAVSITRPLSVFADEMRRLSDDDYATPISGLDRADEIGALSRSLQGFKDKLIVSRDASDMVAKKRKEQAEVVDALGQGLRGLASGDLSVQLEVEFPEEYDRLRGDFNATINTMNDLTTMIVENATEIHARAEEISTSSDDLSQRTESQAATLEQTAAALDELTSSVREAADSASEVEEVVTGARKDAEESGQIVSEAVEAMSMIRKSSNEISQIIGVIDDIAFQTNLLSLNAGVEAARAGDAGRGFAVVASEVRALAQRSSEAAKKIKELITSSSEQVETGVGLVGRTGDALSSIIARVGDIDSLVTGIATGSREQSIGLGEINVGISQLDQVTQQNAAMVEEATAAATTLKNEAAALSQTVARFKLEDNQEEARRDNEVIQFRSTSPKSIAQRTVETTNEALLPELETVALGGSWKDF